LMGVYGGGILRNGMPPFLFGVLEKATDKMPLFYRRIRGMR